MSGSANEQAKGSGPGGSKSARWRRRSDSHWRDRQGQRRTSALTVSGDFATGLPPAQDLGFDRRQRRGRARHRRRGEGQRPSSSLIGGSIAAGVVGIGIAVADLNVTQIPKRSSRQRDDLQAAPSTSRALRLNQNDRQLRLFSLSDCIGIAFAGGGGLVALFGAIRLWSRTRATRPRTSRAARTSPRRQH